MILISEHFNSKKLLRLTFPSIMMMVFTSIYGVVDGFFVSNFVGKTPFTAVNFIMPFLMILGSFGFMFGTGGGALIAKTLGEGDRERSNRIFSLTVYVSVACGIVLAILGILFIRPFAALIGADGQLLEDSVAYGRIILMAIPFYILQYEFQCLFSTAGKPVLGLVVTVASGLTNMVLDALFVAVLSWGLQGAAAATAISQLVGGVFPLIYFSRKNSSTLRLGRTTFDLRVLGQTCLNGSSELLSNISVSLVSMLYNAQLLRYIGEDGIAAYGVLMYVSLIFSAAFIGFSTGVAPVISFHFGAQNTDELRGLFKRCLRIIAIFSVCMVAAALLLAKPLSLLFVSYDEGLLALTVRAFGFFSFSFCFSGFAIFGSSFFTALNDGIVSAAISFLRTLVFQVAAVFLLPLLLDADGIWLSLVVAEALTVVVTCGFFAAKRKKYRY